MINPPAKCPKCGESNNTGINYCAVCGFIFPRNAATGRPAQRGKLTSDQKLLIKKERKRKELTSMFRSKKISLDQYRNGMKKLGYATDADKAEAFKKFIKEQIVDLKNMEVAPKGMEGGSHFDPYQSKSDLPRDDQGKIITEFSVSPMKAPDRRVDAPVVVEVDDCTVTTTGSGPLFGASLFGSSGGNSDREKIRSPVESRKEVPRIFRDETVPKRSKGRGSSRRNRRQDWEIEEVEPADVEFDEDVPEEEEEDFSIDLEEEDAWWDDESDEWWDEEEDGESGWWDDDEWELELDEEGEEDWDLGEGSSITVSDGSRLTVEFDEEDEEELFEIVEDDEEEEDAVLPAKDEPEEDDGFEISLSSRKRKRHRR